VLVEDAIGSDLLDRVEKNSAVEAFQVCFDVRRFCDADGR